MPILTFYVYGAKNKRFAILTIHAWPTDWLNLKEQVKQCMIKLNIERQIIKANLQLELHLPGKYTVKTAGGAKASRGYGAMRVRYGRLPEWRGKVVFNTKTGEAAVSNCTFGPYLWRMRSDYRAEKGRFLEVPPLIPRSQQKLGDAKALLSDPSGAQYADYSRRPQPLYNMEDQQPNRRRIYGNVTERSYLPQNLRILEQEENEKEIEGNSTVKRKA